SVSRVARQPPTNTRKQAKEPQMERSDRSQVTLSPPPRDGRPECTRLQPTSDQLADGHTDFVRGLMLLGLGVALQGADRGTDQNRQGSPRGAAGDDEAGDWPDVGDVLYALVGLLFEAEARTRSGFSAVRRSRARLRARVARATAPLLSRLIPAEVAL